MEHVPDILSFGTQESFSEKFEWEVSLQETIGPSHILFHSVSLGKFFKQYSFYLLKSMHLQLLLGVSCQYHKTLHFSRADNERISTKRICNKITVQNVEGI